MFRQRHTIMGNAAIYGTLLVVVTVFLTFTSAQIVEELDYDLQEELAPPVIIGYLSRDSNVSAVLSSGEVRLLSFRLYASTGSSWFHLDNSSGILSSSSRINRETVCRFTPSCVFTLTVGVQSLMTGSSFFQIVTVKVSILDINDNSPTFFTNSAQFSLSESAPPGTSFIIDGATDLDTGQNNSVKSYILQPTSSIFGIKTQRKLDGSMEVSVVVESVLDRENISRYELVVVAQDGGQPKRTGRMRLTIEVTDVNDNKPLFQHTVYNVTVNETAPINVTIVIVSAVDEDQNENGVVTYRFSSRQTEYDVLNFYAISDTSGHIYPIASLTPLQGRTKRVVVEAMDGGVDAKVSQCIVQISVLDNVNNPPSIRVNLVSSNNTVDLSEAASVGSLVAHFVTEDVDSGQNGDISCNANNSTEFSVRQIKIDQYKIILNRALNREMQAEYPVILTCQDGGSPPLQTSVNLTIMLYDVNDNYPVPTQREYFINVTENNESGFKLLQIEATDKDLGDNGKVGYKLEKVSSSTPTIYVNETTGDVIVMGSFDYEKDQYVNLSIIVEDKGTPPLSATVTVYLTIMDMNDNSPYFNEPVYIFNIKENLAPGVFVGKLQGHDADSGSNGQLNYTIHNNTSLPFMLSHDGYLSTNMTLDREKQPLYTFQVVVYDEGEVPNAGDVQVHVYVLDENDNSPIINLPNPSRTIFPVHYNFVPGTELLHVEAEDADDGENSKLVYELKSDDKPEYFIIDQNSGAIFLNKQLKRSDIGNVSLTVRVLDGGVEPKSAVSNFTFVIIEGNYTSVAYVNDTEQNMLVVIIIVSITLVVAIIVLTIVLMIKRNDRQKQQLSNCQYGLKNMSETAYKKGVHVYESGEEELHNPRTNFRKTSSTHNKDPCHGPQPSKDELIVFKMKLAEKYQVDGADCSFSKETEISDVMSSVSGETGCDSGRGASENECQDDGATSAPNSPRKQITTFKGSTQAPSYFRLDQMRAQGATGPVSQSHIRESLNATDSLKIKTSGSRPRGVNENNSSPIRDNYSNGGQRDRNVPENYQYLNNSKPQYDDRYCQPHRASLVKHSDLMFTRGTTRDSAHQYNKHVLNPREESCRFNSRPSKSSYNDNRNSRDNSLLYTQDGDGYSVDTMDDGHSTTTSGSYTVDNDQFMDDFAVFNPTYHVTHLHHNPGDVYV